MKTGSYILLIILISVAIYSNTTDVPFVFDDEEFIEYNPAVKDSVYLYLPYTLKSSLPSALVKNTIVTRYIGYWSFYLNNLISGDYVLGLHVFNIAVHVACSLAVYLLVLWLATAAGIKNGPARNSLAFWVALLFAVHPVQTQAVTYLSQRFASMVALFYVMAVAFYVRHRVSGKLAWLVASILATLAAMHTKENAFTIPFVVGAVELLFFTDGTRSRALRLLPFVLLLMVIPAHVMCAETWLDKEAINSMVTVSVKLSRSEYLITSIRIMATYLRLLLLPVNQSLDYAYPTYGSLMNPEVLASATLILAMLAWALVQFRRDRARSGYKLLAGFGILWFFVTISVENSAIVLVNVMFEHRLYLPSVGLLLSATCLTYEYAEKFDLKKVAAVIGLCVVLAFSWATYARNEYWRDPARLWADSAAKHPHNARAYGNIAAVLERAGDIANALSMRQVVDISEWNWKAHYNVGSVYMNQGQTTKALEHLDAAARLTPDSTYVHNNLALVYLAEGQRDRALAHLKLAVLLDNRNSKALYNIGIYHIEDGRRDMGVFFLESALVQDERNAKAHMALGKQLLGEGKYAEARSRLESAVSADPQLSAAWYELALSLYMQGRLDDAEDRLAQIAPQDLQPNMLVLMALIRLGKADIAGATKYTGMALAADHSNEAALELRSVLIGNSPAK